MSEVSLQRPLLQRSSTESGGNYEDFKELEELKSLKKVTSLRLYNNYGVEVLSNACQYLPHLKHLHIQNGHVLSLRYLGSCFPKVKELAIVDCDLRSLDGVTGFPNLEVLRLPGNELTSVDHCIHISNLIHLDVERNLISDLKTLEWLSLCQKLTSLILLNNPLYSENNLPKISERDVLKVLPQLRYIDGHPVDGDVQKVEGFVHWSKKIFRQTTRAEPPPLEKYSRMSRSIQQSSVASTSGDGFSGDVVKPLPTSNLE